MVRQRVHAGAAQPLGGVVDAAPRQAVDDAGVALMVFLQKAQELLPGPVLGDDRVPDVGAVETAHELGGAAESQAVHDLAPGGLVGSRGERDAGDVGEVFVQGRELEVLRAEIVSPLGDAVGFVDGEKGEAGAREQFQCAVAEQALRGDVEQVQLAVRDGRFDLKHLLVRQGRVEARGADARLAQTLHLVPHERDQRRDDHAHPVAHDGRDLVAERFAAAGGHENQAVAPGHRVFDYGLLLAEEGRVAEDSVEDFVNVLGHGWWDCCSWRHGACAGGWVAPGM